MPMIVPGVTGLVGRCEGAWPSWLARSMGDGLLSASAASLIELWRVEPAVPGFGVPGSSPRRERGRRVSEELRVCGADRGVTTPVWPIAIKAGDRAGDGIDKPLASCIVLDKVSSAPSDGEVVELLGSRFRSCATLFACHTGVFPLPGATLGLCVGFISGEGRTLLALLSAVVLRLRRMALAVRSEAETDVSPGMLCISECAYMPRLYAFCVFPPGNGTRTLG